MADCEFRPNAGHRRHVVDTVAHRGRPSGWLWDAAIQRLHQRTRRLRCGAAFAAIAGCDRYFHGVRSPNRFRHAPRVGSSEHAPPVPALVVGVVFGAGLALSDMINPARVLAFLDVAGAWDPTLAFVMGSALIPTAIAFALRPHLAGRFSGPHLHPGESDHRSAPDAWGGPFRHRLGPRRLLPRASHSDWCSGCAAWLFVAAMLTGMLTERVFPLFKLLSESRPHRAT